MNRYYSRRKFIKTALLSTGALVLSTLPVKGVTAFPSSASGDDKQSALNEALQAFYRREYDRSEALYRQFIQSFPDDVAGYDGLAKIYNRLMQPVKTAGLYRSALDLNNSNPVFYDRLARALNALSLGNNRQEKEWMSASGETFLTGASASLYLQAIRLAPDKKYLYDGLLDTARCLEKKNRQLKHFNLPSLSFPPETASEITSVTSTYREKWEESRSSLHRGKTTDDLTSALNKIKNKKRRDLYFDDEKRCREESLAKKQKEFIYPWFLKAIRENQTEAMEDYFSRINSLSPSDTQSGHLLSRRYKENKDYKKLVAFRQKEVSKANTAWRQIMLAYALLSDAENSMDSNKAQEALSVFLQAEQKIDFDDLYAKVTGAVYGGMARCRFALSAPDAGRETIIKGLEHLPPASGIAHSLLIDYAGSCDAGNDTKEAEAILLRLSTGNTKKEIRNQFIESYIRQREAELEWRKKNNVGRYQKDRRKENKRKSKERRGIPSQETVSSPENLKSSYALAKIYEKRRMNKEYGDVLTYIEKENPKNQFAGKRKRI